MCSEYGIWELEFSESLTCNITQRKQIGFKNEKHNTHKKVYSFRTNKGVRQESPFLKTNRDIFGQRRYESKVVDSGKVLNGD